MSKRKTASKKIVSLYPPQSKLAIDAMENEFARFISDPKRKARRIKEPLELEPKA